MDRIDFFFDPICPFAWLTSRWATEVSTLSDLDVNWRFISLSIVNEPSDRSEAHRRGHGFGLELLRVAAAVREDHGNDGVASIYTAFGTLLHVKGGSARLWSGDEPTGLVEDALDLADLAASYAAATADASHDELIRAETELALSRTGPDVGTPIITFDLDHPETSSFFGPVMNRVPRGEEAVEMWSALSTLARLSGFAELKRSLRGELDFS